MSAQTITFQADPTPAVAPAAPAAPAAPQGDRPAWLPENCATPEDLARSYAEVQAHSTKLAQELAALKGKKPADPAEAPPKDPSADPAKDPADDAAEKAAKASGFSLDTYSQEFASTGDVAPESRAAIIKGLEGVLGPNAAEIVNDYIEGKKAATANARDAVFSAVGGKDAYVEMVTWAGSALPPAEIAAFNRIADSGDQHAIMFAVEGLHRKFAAANPRAPRRFNASAAPVNGSVTAYASTAEMVADMKDPKYKSDPAFRARVQARIQATG